MSDAMALAAWTALLAAGLGGGVLARARGLATTYARDLLHVGAGIWVWGWPAWRSPVAPVVLVGAAAAATALLPLLARRRPWAARVLGSFSDGDERWSGLVHYTLSFLIFTLVGLTTAPFPAAAALLALAWGDGVGGAVGRRLGRHRFAVPGAKSKSLEGSLAVALAAAAGIAVAALWFGVPVGVGRVAAAGAVAALAEALAPRATDNLLIPPVVWAFLMVT